MLFSLHMSLLLTHERVSFFPANLGAACEYSHFSLLLVAKDVSSLAARS